MGATGAVLIFEAIYRTPRAFRAECGPIDGVSNYRVECECGKFLGNVGTDGISEAGYLARGVEVVKDEGVMVGCRALKCPDCGEEADLGGYFKEDSKPPPLDTGTEVSDSPREVLLALGSI